MIVVLRLGHRRIRDKRISTHVGLVARAFGAQKIIYSGEKDLQLLDSINKVSENWGGKFKVSYEKSWKYIIHAYKQEGFKVVHLTMYGMPLKKRIRACRRAKDLLVIVGGEKVPSEVYQLADFNIGIGNQPHSEVSALGTFLHEYMKGKHHNKKYLEAKMEIVPQEKGKKILKYK